MSEAPMFITLEKYVLCARHLQAPETLPIGSTSTIYVGPPALPAIEEFIFRVIEFTGSGRPPKKYWQCTVPLLIE